MGYRKIRVENKKVFNRTFVLRVSNYGLENVCLHNGRRVLLYRQSLTGNGNIFEEFIKSYKKLIRGEKETNFFLFCQKLAERGDIDYLNVSVKAIEQIAKNDFRLDPLVAKIYSGYFKKIFGRR